MCSTVQNHKLNSNGEFVYNNAAAWKGQTIQKRPTAGVQANTRTQFPDNIPDKLDFVCSKLLAINNKNNFH